ncbi:MAG: FHA domain-containing protein [Verrucomicrobiota bacterium]|nr:FHA domain-containing protein [Verrucomicrobiota bacterium]
MEKKLKPLDEKEIVFDDEPTTFGRSIEADVPIDDPSVSLIHCAIRLWDDVLIIKDTSSTNGTFVNGKKIDKAAIIKTGDQIRIGNIVFEV